MNNEKSPLTLSSSLDDSKTTQTLSGVNTDPSDFSGNDLNISESPLRDAFGSGFVVNTEQTSAGTISVGAPDLYREPFDTTTTDISTPESNRAYDALNGILNGKGFPKDEAPTPIRMMTAEDIGLNPDGSLPKATESAAEAAQETPGVTNTPVTAVFGNDNLGGFPKAEKPSVAGTINTKLAEPSDNYTYSFVDKSPNTVTFKASEPTAKTPEVAPVLTDASPAPVTAPVAPKVEAAPTQSSAPEVAPAAPVITPEAAPIITIGNQVEAAIDDVVSGKEKSVVIELDQNSPYLTALNYRIAKETDPMVKVRLEQEKVAAEKKESRISASGSALSKIKEKLTDPSLTNAEREALEKRRDTLEKINGKLESQRQKLDRGFAERGLTFFRDNVAERWRKGSWKTKVMVGLGLGVAGIAASVSAPALLGVLGVAGITLRGLGGYNLYQGTKQRDIVKLAEAVKKAEAEGKDTEATIKEADKIITENSWNKKGLFFAGLMSIALPEFLKHTEMGQNLVHGLVDKATGVYDHVMGTTPGVHVATADPFAPGTKVGTGSPIVPPEVVKPGVVVTPGGNTGLEGLGYTGDGVVQPGDNMYKILYRSFHIADHVATKGGQYNAIENILAKIKADPTTYGIKSGDVNMLQPGEKIDLAKIQEILASTKIGTESIYDHANKLPAAVVKGIEEYTPGPVKDLLNGGAVVNAGLVETASNDSSAPTANSAVEAASNNAPAPEATNIELQPLPATTLEGDAMMSYLREQFANAKISPNNLNNYLTQNVDQFIGSTNLSGEANTMVNIVINERAASGIPTKPGETVGEYLLRTSLVIIRKNNYI